MGSGITTSATASRSIDEAGRLLGALYGAPMTVSSELSSDFRYEASAVHDGRVSIARLSFTGTLRASGCLDDVVAVWAPGGSHRWRLGEECGDGATPFVLPPGRAWEVELRDARLVTVGFDPGFLERELGRPLAFGDGLNSRARNPGALAPVLGYLDAALRAHPGVFAEPVLRGPAVRLAVDALASVFPLAHGGGCGMPRPVRR